MAQELTQRQVLEFLRLQPIELVPEGRRITIGNQSLDKSHIAGCDLSELIKHLYLLEDMGRITLAHRYPNPFEEHTGLVTNFVFVHDDLLPRE